MKRYLSLAVLFVLSGCTAFKKSPPVAPSSLTQSTANATIGQLQGRLGAIGAYVPSLQNVANMSDQMQALTLLLKPVTALAGTPDPRVVPEAQAVEAAALKGDSKPAEDAEAKALAQTADSEKLLTALNAAFEKDRADQAAFLKQHDAEWQAKLDKANSVVWNLIAGGLILVGVVVTAAGFAIRALALQIPMFGPKVSQAVSVLGATLAIGGVCLYAIGPYLKILAITLGVAALLGLVAAVLCYANHKHAVCSPTSSPSLPVSPLAAT